MNSCVETSISIQSSENTNASSENTNAASLSTSLYRTNIDQWFTLETSTQSKLRLIAFWTDSQELANFGEGIQATFTKITNRKNSTSKVTAQIRGYCLLCVIYVWHGSVPPPPIDSSYKSSRYQGPASPSDWRGLSRINQRGKIQTPCRRHHHIRRHRSTVKI